MDDDKEFRYKVKIGFQCSFPWEIAVLCISESSFKLDSARKPNSVKIQCVKIGNKFFPKTAVDNQNLFPHEKKTVCLTIYITNLSFSVSIPKHHILSSLNVSCFGSELQVPKSEPNI